MPNRSHIDALNATLADYFALYLKTKNFHWHISGPHFRDFHVLLDEQAAEILATTDVIAERIRKQGATTLRSIGQISRISRVKDNDEEDLDAPTMLAELRDDTRALVETLKDVKALVDAAKDNATSGLVDTWTDEAERRAWFLEETLR
ncbi:MAG: Dps family protein [Sphingomonadaceae bacterium]|jgi:starvation-inducible DNA-binding protein